MAEEIQKCGIIPLKLLNSKEISLKAKGMFVYLQSKPSNWQFSIEKMANQLMEGREAIRGALLELENAGYLIRIPKKENGKFAVYNYKLIIK